MDKKTTLEKWSIGLIGLGFLIFIVSIFLFGKHRFYDSSMPIDANTFAGFGSFISGVVGTIISLVGVLLLISNLQEQKRNFIDQQNKNNESTEKQIIETRFFEFLKIIRENTDNLYTKGYVGRRAMVEINKEFNKLFEDISIEYTIEKSNKSEKEWREDLINITYLVLFFGVDENQIIFLKQLINSILPKSYQKEFENNVLYPLAYKHKQTKNSNLHLTKEKRSYLKNDGHQNVLGHYFRHIFQTVTYIDSRTLLNYEEKYEYIKTLRAQLSTIEQLVFFYNSISILGLPWEKKENIIDNKKLITKYNLVKNLTFNLIDNMTVKDFYTKVNYEGHKKTNERIELEKKYS